MVYTLVEQEVLCLGSKATFMGTSIPVWTYILDGLMVDTGPFSLRREFISYFREQRIEQAVLTHYHEDHCGLAFWLQANRNTQVFMPSLYVSLSGRTASLPPQQRMGA